jgi:hypothetical protein
LRNGAQAGVELGVPLKASPYTPSPQPRLSLTLDFPF